MTKGTAWVLGLLAVCMTLLGCSASRDSVGDGDGKGMDMQQAADRADRMLDGTIGAIKPPVQWTHGPTTTGSCDLSRRRTVMTQISPNRRGALLGVIDRFWRKTGYEITSVNSDAEFPGIYARTVDGFQISLSIGGEGQAFFEVATPCVDASAVAESTVPPNGPAYTSGPIPRPNVQDDFWSSSEPLASSSPATP